MRRATLLSLPLLAALAAAAAAVPVRLVTSEGVEGQGELVAIDADGVRIETERHDVLRAPLGQVVGLDFPQGGEPASTGDADESLDDAAVEVILAGDDRLLGILVDGSEDTLKLKSPVVGEVTLPLEAVRALRFVKAGDVARRARPDVEKDSLTFRTGDTLTGWVTSFTPDALRIDCVIRDDYRVPFDRLAAVLLHQEMPPPPKDLVVRLTLRDGSRLTVRSPVLGPEGLRASPVVSPPDARPWTVPLGALRHLTVRNGAFDHLSDAASWTAAVVPYFPPADPLIDPNEWLAPRRDRSFAGGDLRLEGRTIRKGVGVVSGTTIRVPLEGAFRQFRGTVGVDDAAGPRGSVTFEILVDGRSRWTSPNLRSGQAPVHVPPVDLSGARTLELRVGYGDDDSDVHDLADWGEAILVR